MAFCEIKTKANYEWKQLGWIWQARSRALAGAAGLGPSFTAGRARDAPPLLSPLQAGFSRSVVGVVPFPFKRPLKAALLTVWEPVRPAVNDRPMLDFVGEQAA